MQVYCVEAIYIIMKSDIEIVFILLQRCTLYKLKFSLKTNNHFYRVTLGSRN